MIGNINRNNKYIIDEINKCILLCANCHYEIEDKEVKEMNKINKEGDDL
jgi:hypothetical protein